MAGGAVDGVRGLGQGERGGGCQEGGGGRVFLTDLLAASRVTTRPERLCKQRGQLCTCQSTARFTDRLR